MNIALFLKSCKFEPNSLSNFFVGIQFVFVKKLECVVLSTTYVLILEPIVSVHQKQHLLEEQIVPLIISSLMEEPPLVIYQPLSIQRISFVELFSMLLILALLLDLFVVSNSNVFFFEAT